LAAAGFDFGDELASEFLPCARDDNVERISAGRPPIHALSPVV